MRFRKDIHGKRFGNLVVQKYEDKGKWSCLCDCGAIRLVMANKLATGHTRSCGCLKRKISFHNKPEYSSWQHMKRRCKADPAYIHAKICDRWLDSFENFLADMGNKPSPDASIDRIDNKKGYEPSNCRWASKLVQTLNRDWNKNNTSGVRGVTWDSSKKKWVAQISIKDTRVSKRFNSLDDAAQYRKHMEAVLFAPIFS